MAEAIWRLLRDPEGNAAWNMSVDEALLKALPEEAPALRLYTWSRPAASLGYRQPVPAWATRCAELGIEIVRRATGGGTVLHAGDLTYAVAVPRDCRDLPAGVRASYEWIRAVLIRGLRRAGLNATPAAGSPAAARTELCFQGATGSEIELDETKLVGSAQRRVPWGLLQHGSIRIAEDRAVYRALLGFAPERPQLSARVSVADVADALGEAFSEALGGRLEPATLSPLERELATLAYRERLHQPLGRPALSSRRPGACADRLP